MLSLAIWTWATFGLVRWFLSLKFVYVFLLLLLLLGLNFIENIKWAYGFVDHAFCPCLGLSQQNFTQNISSRIEQFDQIYISRSSHFNNFYRIWPHAHNIQRCCLLVEYRFTEKTTDRFINVCLEWLFCLSANEVHRKLFVFYIHLLNIFSFSVNICVEFFFFCFCCCCSLQRKIDVDITEKRLYFVCWPKKMKASAEVW